MLLVGVIDQTFDFGVSLDCSTSLETFISVCGDKVVRRLLWHRSEK